MDSPEAIDMEGILKFVPNDAIDRIKDEFTRIAEITDKESIAALYDQDKVTAEMKQDIRVLLANGIVAEGLLPEEAHDIHNFCAGLYPEAKNARIQMVADMLALAIRNLSKKKNPTEDDLKDLTALKSLRDRYERYKNNINFSFDDYDVEDVRSRYPDLPEEKLHDREYLMDMGYLEMDENSGIGPFSDGDLARILNFGGNNMIQANTTRSGFLLSRFHENCEKRDLFLITDIVMRRGFSVVEDCCIRKYIQDVVLPKRRLPVRDLVIVFAACGLAMTEGGLLDEITGVSKSWNNEDVKDIATYMRKALAEGSRYCLLMCGEHTDEVYRNYGTSRPVNEEIYHQIIDEAASWTDHHVEFLERNYEMAIKYLNLSMVNTRDLIKAYNKIRQPEEPHEEPIYNFES